jgi:general stress protein 26
MSEDDTLAALAKRIKSIRAAMLVTTDKHGNPWSRPMITRDMDENGTLWFFTKRNSQKVSDITADNRVTVVYTNPDDALYVSVRGRAEVVHDMARKKELWNPLVKAWFPDGLDDPELVLLKVTPERAEYWQGPSTQVGRAISIAAKLVTGGKVSTGKQVAVKVGE